MRRPALVPVGAVALVLAALTVTLASGCSDATGSVQGGQALTTCGASGAGGGDSTFTSLYGDFFGPCGRASCSGQASCHGAASQSGSQISGFVCGTTKDECWQGMTQGIAVAAGGFFCPIVCVGTCPQNPTQTCPTDPTQQLLWTSIHKAQASGLNHMPCGDPTLCQAAKATYTFTADDLARIQAWIQAGAQND
jgi:hypothetical protein